MISFVVQQTNFTEMAEFTAGAAALAATASCSTISWNTWGEREFHRQAVHLPDNPFYPAYVRAARALRDAAAGEDYLSFDRAIP